MAGPLNGLKVVEMQGLGPAPFCAMVLADLGAEVLRLARPGTVQDAHDVLARGRQVLTLDLRDQAQRERALVLIERADVLLEGFRPGVMDRLGLGWAVLHTANPKLVLCSLSGWGQTGPLRDAPGHDLNYAALAGVTDQVGNAAGAALSNLPMADLLGGAMGAVTGVLAALFDAARTGQGRHVDIAMADGVLAHAVLPMAALQQHGRVQRPGEGTLTGGLACYGLYDTADGRQLAVGALEPKFYANLTAVLGLNDLPAREDSRNWPAIRQAFEDTFATRTRDEWTEVFQGTDACVSPVLGMTEAISSPHLSMRGTYSQHHGEVVPAPAPVFGGRRFSLARPAVFSDAMDAVVGWGGR